MSISDKQIIKQFHDMRHKLKVSTRRMENLTGISRRSIREEKSSYKKETVQKMAYFLYKNTPK